MKSSAKIGLPVIRSSHSRLLFKNKPSLLSLQVSGSFFHIQPQRHASSSAPSPAPESEGWLIKSPGVKIKRNLSPKTSKKHALKTGSRRQKTRFRMVDQMNEDKNSRSQQKTNPRVKDKERFAVDQWVVKKAPPVEMSDESVQKESKTNVPKKRIRRVALEGPVVRKLQNAVIFRKFYVDEKEEISLMQENPLLVSKNEKSIPSNQDAQNDQCVNESGRGSSLDIEAHLRRMEIMRTIRAKIQAPASTIAVPKRQLKGRDTSKPNQRRSSRLKTSRAKVKASFSTMTIPEEKLKGEDASEPIQRRWRRTQRLTFRRVGSGDGNEEGSNPAVLASKVTQILPSKAVKSTKRDVLRNQTIPKHNPRTETAPIKPKESPLPIRTVLSNRNELALIREQEAAAAEATERTRDRVRIGAALKKSALTIAALAKQVWGRKTDEKRVEPLQFTFRKVNAGSDPRVLNMLDEEVLEARRLGVRRDQGVGAQEDIEGENKEMRDEDDGEYWDDASQFKSGSCTKDMKRPSPNDTPNSAQHSPNTNETISRSQRSKLPSSKKPFAIPSHKAKIPFIRKHSAHTKMARKYKSEPVLARPHAPELKIRRQLSVKEIVPATKSTREEARDSYIKRWGLNSPLRGEKDDNEE